MCRFSDACTHFPISVELSTSEKDGMKHIWKAGFKTCKLYYSKKKEHRQWLGISEAHHSGLAVM
jgi:hypothetical protein